MMMSLAQRNSFFKFVSTYRHLKNKDIIIAIYQQVSPLRPKHPERQQIRSADDPRDAKTRLSGIPASGGRARLLEHTDCMPNRRAEAGMHTYLVKVKASLGEPLNIFADLLASRAAGQDLRQHVSVPFTFYV